MSQFFEKLANMKDIFDLYFYCQPHNSISSPTSLFSLSWIVKIFLIDL